MSRVFSQRFRSSIPRVEGDERSTDTSALFFYFLPFVSFRTVAIHLLVIIGERRRACDRATMEMHILPFVVPLVPYAALLALVGVRYSLFVHVLCQPNVRDARSIFAKQVYMGIQDRRVHGFAVFPQHCIIKVKFVEIHSLD